jgi:hypothetical protein
MADDPAGRLWSGIAWEIRRGRHPNKDDVIAALRLGDPRPLPADVQLYVARLLAGELEGPASDVQNGLFRYFMIGSGAPDVQQLFVKAGGTEFFSQHLALGP